MKFTLKKECSHSAARLGRIETAHSTIETPQFMPVGTRASVKTMTNQNLFDIGAEIILGNTYHLLLRPGMEIIEAAEGLHKFMNWPRSILTDSGGYQVFSLSQMNKITDEGVHFQSHVDGAKFFLGPKESMEVQKILGSDIVMAYDQCPPYPCERSEIEKAMERTLRWEKICRNYDLQEHQNLFGIVQGGMHHDLREQCAKELISLNFEGYAIGGLSVGEPAHLMYEVLDNLSPHLPKDKPRYLMGVGTPRNLIEAVRRGVDMFDCVMPTRNARNGTAYTWQGKINIKAGRYAKDFSPLDEQLDCYASSFSKAYIRHLLNVDEVTGKILVTLQNLAFYLDFMKKLRHSLAEETFETFYQQISEIYPE